MSKKRAEKLVAGLVAVVFLLILSRVSAAPGSTSADASPAQTSPETASPPAPLLGKERGETNALVLKVVDGDTMHVKLDNGEEATIRFLGVNTPETVDPRRPVECFGKEASDFSKSMLSDARVRLDPDPEADEVDKYGRLLRNVRLQDGTDFNATLVREGYAYAYVDFPQNKERKVELIRLQDEARIAERGLWAEGVCER